MSLKTVENGQTWYRVFSGPYDSQDAALASFHPSIPYHSISLPLFFILFLQIVHSVQKPEYWDIFRINAFELQSIKTI